MNREDVYEIYTDASFDEKTKLGTYAIVIKKENTLIKTISKKCRLKLENSTECEVFGVYQAINYIAGTLLNKRKKQSFRIVTDCNAAMQFFKVNGRNFSIFKDEKEISFLMRNLYKKINKRLIKRKRKT